MHCWMHLYCGAAPQERRPCPWWPCSGAASGGEDIRLITQPAAGISKASCFAWNTNCGVVSCPWLRCSGAASRGGEFGPTAQPGGADDDHGSGQSALRATLLPPLQNTQGAYPPPPPLLPYPRIDRFFFPPDTLKRVTAAHWSNNSAAHCCCCVWFPTM